MADKKINDLSLAGSITDNMQLETDIGGSTANKITASQLHSYIGGNIVPDTGFSSWSGSSNKLSLSGTTYEKTYENIVIPNQATAEFSALVQTYDC